MRWKKYLQNTLIVTFIGLFFIVLLLGILRYKKQTIANTITPVAVTNSVRNTVNTVGNTTENSTNTSSNTTSQNTVTNNTNVTPQEPATASFDGSTYNTPFGEVAVSITVSNKKIVDVTTPTYPDSPPSVYAQSELISQALAANSANIQGVSGATYTSLAFAKSLESAISKAGNAL